MHSLEWGSVGEEDKGGSRVGVGGRGHNASDSGYATDSPGYTAQLTTPPGHTRYLTTPTKPENSVHATPEVSDYESDCDHDALSVSSAHEDDDEVFFTDMMSFCIDTKLQVSDDGGQEADVGESRLAGEQGGLAGQERDSVDGMPDATRPHHGHRRNRPRDLLLPTASDIPGALSLPAAQAGDILGASNLPSSQAMDIPGASSLPTSQAMDIPGSRRHRDTRCHVNFTPPRFYSTAMPFPPNPRSPPFFGSASDSVFTFPRRPAPPSLQRSLQLEFSTNRQRSLSDDSNSKSPSFPAHQPTAVLRERALSETDMGRARTQSESAVTAPRPDPRPAGFRDRCYSESALQVRLQRHFGRELRRISDEFHVTYTPSSSPRERGAQLRPSRSFPGSSRGACWWQSIVQHFSPFFGHRLETIESPVDVNDSLLEEEEDDDHLVTFNIEDLDDLDGDPQCPE